LQRAVRTCELVGFGAVVEVDPDLVEWNYGEYETLRDSEILAKYPDWQLFRDGCPGGESATQIAERADRVVQRVRAVGSHLSVNPTSLSALGHEHTLSRPVIRLWNDNHHVAA